MAVECSIDGCGRKHAAHGLCLMHYKRVKKHGSADYMWAGKPVGRACQFCDRPAAAREMCMRHYQMWRNHGDPLFADTKKVDGLKAGTHRRRGYLMVSPVAEMTKAQPSDATVEKTHGHNKKVVFASHGLRDGSKVSRRQWEHRKVAGALPGQIVHHIDGVKTNNSIENLHVFADAKSHGDAHRSLEKIAFHLLQTGLVEFDRETGTYRLHESAQKSNPCN